MHGMFPESSENTTSNVGRGKPHHIRYANQISNLRTAGCTAYLTSKELYSSSSSSAPPSPPSPPAW